VNADTDFERFIEFLRKGMAPYEVDAGMVHPVPFVEAISPYRPRLTSGVE